MPANAFDWSFRAEGAREAGVLLGILEKLDNILGVLTRREQQTAQTFKDLGNTFARVDSGVEELTSAFNKYQQATANASQANTQYQQKIDNSIRTNNTYKNTLDQSTSTVNKYSTRVDNSTKIQQKYDNRVDNSVTVINRYSAATQRSQGRLQSLGRTLTRAAGVWNTWNKAIDFAAKRFRQFVGLLTGWEKSLRQIGGTFERSEATLRVLAKGAGSTSEEIDTLVTTVKQLGRETEFTAGQAADGAITLLKAGNDATQSVTKLEGALEAALATGLDFGKAAKIGNYAWNIFGKNLGKTGDLTQDYSTALKVMIASANSADMTVSQLGSSLTNGGNILSDLGVSLTRTTTALGLLANRGVLGRKAMRLLAISVKRLVDGTAPARKALQNLGVTAIDPSGKLKDLGVLMEELGTKLDLRPPNEQIRLMKGLFGAGDKVMRTLLDAGLQGFNALENSIEGALGTMGELKEAKIDTIVGAWKQFRSAVEGVWVELVTVLRVPVMEYWETLANVLRKVAGRISDIGERFRGNKKTLQDWIELVRSGGIKGLFEGLPEELEPELQQLETIWEAFVQTVSALLREVWDAFLTSETLDRMKEFAKNIGKAILEGIKAGVGNETFDKLLGLGEAIAGAVSGIGAGTNKLAEIGRPLQAVGVFFGETETGSQRRQIKTLETHLEQMRKKKEEVLAIPVIRRTEEDVQRLRNVHHQIGNTITELRKLRGEKPVIVPEFILPETQVVKQTAEDAAETFTQAFKEKYSGEEGYGGWEAQMDAQIELINRKAKEAAAERERMEKGAVQEIMRPGTQKERTPRRISYMGEAREQVRQDLVILSEEELKAKQEVLNTQQQLTEEENRYKEAIEQSKNILIETNVAINEISSNFEQWMLNPVNVFQQKLLQVKQTFGDMIESFQKKKVDLAEKFGLKSAEDATKERKRIAEEGLKRDERLLQLAQTPEEQMKIRERQAERAAGLAEMTEGEEQRQHVQRAQKFLDKAAAAAADAEKLEIKRLEIQQDYAKKNLAEYEAMVGQAEKAGGRAAALELAQQAYMQLGPEYAEKAAKATEELKVAKAEAATEEAERFKQMAENSSIQVELLGRMVEIAEGQLNAFRTQAQIPQNSDFASDVG